MVLDSQGATWNKLLERLFITFCSDLRWPSMLGRDCEDEGYPFLKAARVLDQKDSKNELFFQCSGSQDLPCCCLAHSHCPHAHCVPLLVTELCMFAISGLLHLQKLTLGLWSARRTVPFCARRRVPLPSGQTAGVAFKRRDKLVDEHFVQQYYISWIDDAGPIQRSAIFLPSVLLSHAKPMPALLACTLLMRLTQIAIHSQIRVPQMRLLMRVCGQKYGLGALASTLMTVPGARISKSAYREAPGLSSIEELQSVRCVQMYGQTPALLPAAMVTRLPKSATFQLNKFGERLAAQLAELWVHRMGFLVDLWGPTSSVAGCFSPSALVA